MRWFLSIVLWLLAACGGCGGTVDPAPEPPTPIPGILADDPAWSPTHRDTIVYRRHAPGGVGWEYPCLNGLFLLNLQTREEELLVAWGHSPRWSPDGRRLAFVIGESAAAEIYIMDVATRVQTRLTDNSDGDFLDDWSPDGTRLIFGSNIKMGLCVMHVERPEPAEWTCFERGLSEARWTVTPIGEKIAYSTGVGNDRLIYRMNPDGSSRVQLSDRLEQADEVHSEPEWGPSGEILAFRRAPGNAPMNGEIWSIRYDGADQKLLNADAATAFFSQMTWSPGGSKIAYVSLAPDNTAATGLSHTVWVMEADGTDPRVLVYWDSVAADSVWR